MCGIFGISVNKASDIAVKDFKRIFSELFILSESRGKEASGFAINNGSTIQVYKAPFAASDTIKTSKYNSTISHFFENNNSFRCAIGHSRLVTNGYEQFNQNNQPVIKNNLAGVHNGIIVNESEIWEQFNDEKRLTDLDSELIPTLISRFYQSGGNLKKAIKMMYHQIYGMTSIAFLFADFQNLLLATNNGSLYYAYSRDENSLIFASESLILQTLLNNPRFHRYFNLDNITQLKPMEMALIDIVTTKIELESINSDHNSKEFSVISPCNNTCEIVEISNDKPLNEIYINKSLRHETVKVSAVVAEHINNCVSRINVLKRCNRCLLPETFPFIEYNNEGTCNYCRNHKKNVFEGIDKLKKILDAQRSEGRRPDCLVPFSGGRDSSFALHVLKKELGMTPIAFSYDWGMLTDLGRRNQARMCGKLGVEHILISADIRKKRNNIRKNVLAWSKHPNLGSIPLFMAGDKKYFYYSNLLMHQNRIKISILGENMLETTNFKSGFCGIKPRFGKEHTYSLSMADKIRMMAFYGKEYLLNTAYLNTSIFDTLDAFNSYYLIKHKNINLFNYIPWDEQKIRDTLHDEYDWETDPGTTSTWRIGDGTSAFYNYIYYIVAGFTENDTFRSNQIREGLLTRDEALKLVNEENKPRFDSIKWYCDTIQVDFQDIITIINKVKKLF